jgi:hypothetical protein
LKNNFSITFLFLIILGVCKGQENTFSPYSRYGLGEMASTTFAHNTAMGGAHIALKPDSTMPIFINAGNPAAYSLIRLTSLEVGGRYYYSDFTGGGRSLKKWGAQFAYGALGFPVGKRGGACFGIMPYSNVGYNSEANVYDDDLMGNVTYKYEGTGGLNKAFLGYGVSPFTRQLTRFRRRNLHVPDSLRHLTASQYRIREFGSKMLSDFSIGFNANYIFGSITNTTRIIYPNSLLYNNTYRERDLTMGDFSGNFGIQTAIGVDSARSGAGHRRALRERVKFTFGYFMSLNNRLKATYSSAAYNYILNGAGQEIIRDTALFNIGQKTHITLPLEQGVGIGFKKGERINVVADFAVTNWSKFRYLDALTSLKDNYRIAAGINFVPEKYAAGRNAFFRRLNYRFGASYQTGYISIRNTVLSNAFVSAGVGIPVGIGRISSMVNVGAQYGQMGTTANNLVKENYWRINFGFTFCDRWFQKYRYD